MRQKFVSLLSSHIQKLNLLPGLGLDGSPIVKPLPGPR
jgi:hypothetical protein